MKMIFIILQVVLYHLNRYKWEILAYGLLLTEAITFATALLSDDMGAYSGIMAILAFSGIVTAVKLEISEKSNRNRHS